MRNYRLWLCTACALVLMVVTTNALAASYTILRYRDQGSEVRTMQTALLALNYDCGKADGKFGLGTQAAVMAFQKDSDLKADGVAGSKTLAALYDKSSSSSSDKESSESSSSSSTLRYGDKGSSVTSLQKSLNNLGYNCGKADGHFGTGTQRAVIAFQKAWNLKADGIAGKSTLAALQKAASGTDAPSSGNNNGGTSSSTDMPTRTLRKGSSGNDVSSVQSKLNGLDYNCGKVDGKYGTGTVNAVAAFQTKNGLSADGICGKKTYTLLFSGNAKSADSSNSSTTAPDKDDDNSNGYVIPTRTLRNGDTGEDVKSVQKRLNELKYSAGKADGKYGTGTMSAISAFQQTNSLTADGLCGKKTYTLLFSDKAKEAGASSGSSGSSGSSNSGKIDGPSKSSVQLLHWFDDVKPTIRNGQTCLVYDPATGYSWTLRFMSLGRHADSEPLTAKDTAAMNAAFGNITTWNQKSVYVKLPDGRWTVASTHNYNHLSGGIKDNNFDGHLCLHFLRDMDECSKNDPIYGVSNQNTIRKTWKSLTGIDYVEKQ